MGVKTCAVEDCENILCERRNRKYGYICDECFHRLIGYVQERRILGIWDIDELIEKFMRISVQKKLGTNEGIEKKLNEIFPLLGD